MVDWERLTFARVRVLRELSDGRTFAELSNRLHVSRHTVVSTVRELRHFTGCEDSRALARWWRAHRQEWLTYCQTQAESHEPPE